MIPFVLLIQNQSSVSQLFVDTVEDTDPVSVALNTQFFLVNFLLPITKQITLSNGLVITCAVTWAEGVFDESVADDYVLEGVLTLPENVQNPSDVKASVTVTIETLLTPDLLSNQIIWLRETNSNTANQVDNWTNKFNGALDLVKITDARRPNVNATGIDGNPSYDFTLANADVLRSEAGLGLSADFTIYALIKVAAFASNQLIFQNTDNDVSAGNTGIQLQARSTSVLWADFRKNVPGQQQRIEWPYSSTGWHLIIMKQDANGAGASINIVKQDGALIRKNMLMEPVAHNSNTFKLGGNGFDSTTPFGGSMAEILLTSDAHNALTASRLIDYFKTWYPTQLAGLAFFDDDQFFPMDALTEAWNGLDSLQRSDGKYDFIGGTLTGKVYYFTQGATVNNWTTTLIEDTSREIQSLKIGGRDSSGRLIIYTCHKDSSAGGDAIGKIVAIRADTTNDKGAYSFATIFAAHDYPQNIKVHDIDGDGEDEFIFSFQGNGSGEGGVSWAKCSDIDDVLNPAVWTEHVCIQHSGAWHVDGPYNIGGVDRFPFSGRNNRNPGIEVPGFYYVTPATTITDTWPETTIDNSALDFGHWDIGNIFGNDNDLIIQNFTNDDIYGYDAANSYAKSTIITGGTSSFGTNLKIVPGYVINGRSCFLSIVELDWAYLCYYNGSTWSRRKLFKTGEHSADNEIFFLDVDDSGYMTVVFDDNTDLANSHVYKFRL